MTISATINAKELTKLFDQLGNRAKDLRPAMRKIGGMLERASENAFNRQGPGWKRLKEPYRTRKIKEFGAGKKILERDGNLASSVSSQIFGNNKVAIGSNLEYARVHQQGSPKQKIPKREYLIVGEAEMRKSIFILSKHLLRPL